MSAIWPPHKPLTIAHRGARSLAPENTLAAARKAWELGADGWELDVGVSADGVLYLIHDDTLARTSDVAQRLPDRAPWHSDDLLWDEIRSLDFGSWFVETDPFGQIAAGAVGTPELSAYRGERVPTLEEAIAFTCDLDWWVNVEIKDQTGREGDGRIVADVIGTVERLGMVERVLVSSFNHEYLLRVKQLNPRIATGALVAVPHPDPIHLLRELDAQAYHPAVFLLQPGDVAVLNEAGVDVVVWTVNEVPVMRRLASEGARGIISDFPQHGGRP